MPTSLSLLPKKSFAEFFAGVGLMRMGLERQGWSIEFANDIDPLKHEMYLAQFVDQTSHFLIGDIHKIPAEKCHRSRWQPRLFHVTICPLREVERV